MAEIYGFPNTNDYDQIDKELFVAGCGYDQDYNHYIMRPYGRDDYHIVYISQGNGNFLIAGKMQKVCQGHFVFYKPFEMHEYYFDTDKPLKRFWIHFSGTKSKDYVDSFQLLDSPIHYVGISEILEDYFVKLTRELQIQDSNYIKICRGYLVSLLGILSRNSSPNSKHNISGYNKLEQVVYYINDHCSDNLSIEDYANMCYLSKYRFIVNFKHLTGLTPIDYRNKIRINSAKRLLREDNCNVANIAELLGFNSATYFSTIFRHYTGISPREYIIKRKQRRLYSNKIE